MAFMNVAVNGGTGAENVRAPTPREDTGPSDPGTLGVFAGRISAVPAAAIPRGPNADPVST